jgi:hypothetical protein
VLATLTVPIAAADLSPAAERNVAVTSDTSAAPVAAATEQGGGNPQVFSGVADASGVESPRWQSVDFEAEGTAVHLFELDWSGDAMLRIDIREADTGTWVGANTSTARPKPMSAHLTAGTSYRVAVWAMEGVGAFTVTVDQPPPATTTTSTSTTTTTTTTTTSTTTAPGSEELVLPPNAVFDGTVDARRSAAPRWISTDYTPASSGARQFELEWPGNAMLRIDIREADTGTWIAANTSTAQPKTMTANLTAGTRYRLAVWAMRGSADFVVTVDEANAPPPPATTTTTTAAPPTTTTTAAPAPPARGSFAGDPAVGTLYWGAAVGGNDDPARHEDPAGHVLTVRRTFFQWRHRTGYMVDTARADLAEGRLPWVSTKTPSWAEMAAGDHDAAIDEMLRALDALNGPVWLTIHHEPEGGGGINAPDDPAGPAGHVAMNRRVRERMDALGTDNIALAPILMSWTWDPRSGRNASEWWAPGIYDFLGVDHYEEQEASLVTGVWYDVRRFAAARGVDVAVGEWGMRGTDAAAGQRVRDWFDHAAASHADGRGARVIGLAAFDSHLNAPTGSWELRGEQLRAFHQLLFDPRTAEV